MPDMYVHINVKIMQVKAGARVVLHGGEAPVIKAASSVCLAVMINCDVKKCAMLCTYKGID